jgi:hypothetical protein
MRAFVEQIDLADIRYIGSSAGQELRIISGEYTDGVLWIENRKDVNEKTLEMLDTAVGAIVGRYEEMYFDNGGEYEGVGVDKFWEISKKVLKDQSAGLEIAYQLAIVGELENNRIAYKNLNLLRESVVKEGDISKGLIPIYKEYKKGYRKKIHEAILSTNHEYEQICSFYGVELVMPDSLEGVSL